MIETSAMNDIVVGRPRTWPSTCSRWPCPNRVKSGMFSDSVAQNAIMPISDGAKIFQKSASQPSCDGWSKIGPKPPALTSIQIISARNATVTSGAAQFSNRRSASIPRQISTIWITQKNAKLSHSVHGCPPIADAFGPAVAGQLADDHVDRLAADPGLDAEPAAGDERPQQRRQVRAAEAVEGAGEHRERDAVLGAGMAVQQHRDQHDQVRRA